MVIYFKGSDITKEEFAAYESQLNEAEALIKAHEVEVESYLRNNSSNPDVYFAGLAPDEYLHTEQGWVGVIDLGLSHKWACVNVGGVMLEAGVNYVPASFKEFLGVAVKPDESKIVSEAEIRYLDFMKGVFISDCVTKEMVLNYIEGAEKYAIDYKKYAPQYFKEVEYRYVFLAKPYDTYVVFGYPSLWEPGRKTTVSTSLNPSEDAATVLWGSSWATPSKADMEELASRCTWQELYINNQKGALVTGPSKKSIWLPLVGAKSPEGEVVNEGYGYYLSNSKDIQNTMLYSWTLTAGSRGAKVATQPGEYGYSLRPVLK